MLKLRSMLSKRHWRRRHVRAAFLLCVLLCAARSSSEQELLANSPQSAAEQVTSQPFTSPVQPLEPRQASKLAEPIANEQTSKVVPKWDVISNDANKEVIDYNDEIIGSLDFVQTLKMADGQARVNQMLATNHNNEQIYEYLSELNRQYPDLTRVYSIGKSVEGRDLWAIEITESPGKHQHLKPEFRYVANMHGNEIVPRETVLHLARLLLENYRAAQEEPQSEQSKPSGPKFVRKLLRETRIHLLPSLNPDGYARSQVSCHYEMPSRKGRVNANNVDLNRNFPDKQLNSHLDASTQPETRAFMEWSQSEPFVLSASLHAGALIAIIPYAGALDKSAVSELRLTPDDDVFTHLALVYSKNHKTMSQGKDCYDRCSDYHAEHEFPNGIVHGSEWYSIYGSLGDWLYDNTNEFDITVEMGCNQYPEAGLLPTYWDYHKKSLVSFIRETHKGIKGLVVDDSGRPLSNVVVHVSGREHDITTNSFGEYFRLLLPGTYEVTYQRSDLKPLQATINLSHPGMAQVYNIKMFRKDDSNMSQFINESLTTLSNLNGDVSTTAPEASTSLSHNNDDHSIVVATLIMSVITLVLILLMGGAYIIQKRRLTRSQSVSVELQPRSASTGVSLSGKTSSTSLGGNTLAGGSSTNQHPHLSA